MNALPKIIDSTHYHIWSDALHLRQLARQTSDRWDEATYVRSAIIMAWTAFETALSDIFVAQRLGNRFRDNLDAAIRAANLPPLDWSKGVWQAVIHLNDRRVDYVHRTATATDLFPNVGYADEAFDTVRNALSDMCQRAGKAVPGWVFDDADRGWIGGGASRCSAYGTATHAGADPDSPDTLRITYVDAHGEHIHAYHPSSADPHLLATNLFKNLRTPVSVIRVYRGAQVELEWAPRMRGAP